MPKKVKKEEVIPALPVAKIIELVRRAGSFKELLRIQRDFEPLPDRASSAIWKRMSELGRASLAALPDLSFDNLKPVEKAIAATASQIVGWSYMNGRPPHRTLKQLNRKGWIGAVIACVERSRPTSMFQLTKARGKLELSYEQIVMKYPKSFNDRTMWFARRNLELPNETARPPRRRTRA